MIKKQLKKRKAKKRKAKKRQVKRPEDDGIKYCKCPNCRLKAVRIGKKIICESCDAIFIIKKEREAHVEKVGVTQEIIKPKKSKKRGFWNWCDE